MVEHLIEEVELPPFPGHCKNHIAQDSGDCLSDVVFEPDGGHSDRDYSKTCSLCLPYSSSVEVKPSFPFPVPAFVLPQSQPFDRALVALEAMADLVKSIEDFSIRIHLIHDGVMRLHTASILLAEPAFLLPWRLQRTMNTLDFASTFVLRNR